MFNQIYVKYSINFELLIILSINNLNKYNSRIILVKQNSIENFEKNNINDFSKEWLNIRHRRQATFEAIYSQKNKAFINV